MIISSPGREFEPGPSRPRRSSAPAALQALANAHAQQGQPPRPAALWQSSGPAAAGSTGTAAAAAAPGPVYVAIAPPNSASQMRNLTSTAAVADHSTAADDHDDRAVNVAADLDAAEHGARVDLKAFSLDAKSAFIEFERIAVATSNFSAGNFLGEGSFGMVYRGRMDFRTSGVEVAVKVIKKPESADIKEVKTISQLPPHPNVVECLGHSLFSEPMRVYKPSGAPGPDGAEAPPEVEYIPMGALCIVYEYVAPAKLENWLRAYKESACPYEPLTWEERVRLLLDIASGLKHLHNPSGESTSTSDEAGSAATSPSKPRGIVHRDFRSANILVRKSGSLGRLEAVIADFGLSGPADASGAYTNCGSGRRPNIPLGYTDPEYVITGQHTQKGDIFGFGVIILELVTGLCGYEGSRADYRSLILLLDKYVQERDRAKMMADTKAPGKLAEALKDAIDRLLSIAQICVRLHGKDRQDATRVEANIRKIAEEMGLVDEEPQSLRGDLRRNQPDSPHTPETTSTQGTSTPAQNSPAGPGTPRVLEFPSAAPQRTTSSALSTVSAFLSRLYSGSKSRRGS